MMLLQCLARCYSGRSPTGCMSVRSSARIAPLVQASWESRNLASVRPVGGVAFAVGRVLTLDPSVPVGESQKRSIHGANERF
jgi:hypothetical protein